MTHNITRAQLEILRAAGVNIEKPGSITFEVIDHSETAIVIKPEMMNKKEVATVLMQQYTDEENVQLFAKDFEGRHYTETLVAITRVLNRELNAISGAKGGFFGPSCGYREVTVDIKDGKVITENAFFGDFVIHQFDEADAEIAVKGASYVIFKITCKKKFESYVTALFAKVTKELQENSIYKGKGIVVTKENNMPHFQLQEIKSNKAIFLNEKEELLVQDYIIDELATPKKRTALLTGDYGTGKTESVQRIGEAGIAQGMSFFYVKDASLFTELLTLSKAYGPSIVYMEDIDEIAGDEERDAAMNKILNTLDGVEVKARHLWVILTTNHIEKINSALKRPGRLDVIVQFQNPAHETKIKIFQHYFSSLVGFDDLDLPLLSEYIGSISGAFVAEICKRSVIQSKKKGVITNDIVKGAYASLEYHIQAMTNKAEVRSELTLTEIVEAAVQSKVQPVLAWIAEH
jgi:hypothetical protein